MHPIFQQYVERLQRRSAKPNTLVNLRRTATLFEEGGIDPLTAEDWQIEQWFASLDLSPRTKRLHVENLNAVYGYAVHRRQLDVSPMESVKLPKEPDKEPRILSNDELVQLIAQASTYEDWLLIHLLIYTGMRRAEIRRLAWEDISEDSIMVLGKGDKLRHIPIHPCLAATLIEGEKKEGYVIKANLGQPISDTGILNRLKRVRRGIDCSFHDFRRTVATSLAENDVPEGIIDRIMGWAPRTVGSRYYIRRADGKLQEAILKLYADDPLLSKSPALAGL